MKPKTKIQKEVARLSATLRPITATQERWAYSQCFEHIAYRGKTALWYVPSVPTNGLRKASRAINAVARNVAQNSQSATLSNASQHRQDTLRLSPQGLIFKSLG